MKKVIFLSCMFLIILTGARAQTQTGEIDSVWIAKTYFPRIVKNHGQKLLDPNDLTDSSGNKVNLSCFKGKLLYIDIWATTCGPCIASFPHGEQLHKRVAALGLDTAIQFLTICIDGSVRDWKSLVKKHHPSGLNLYSSKADAKWRIKMYPTYMIIDSTGRILSGDACSPEDSLIDFMLYAATKGISPAKAIWQEYRQYNYYRTNNRYTDDMEGQEYAKWFKASAPGLIEYYQWQQNRKKPTNN